MTIDYTKLSKTISKALRHTPTFYKLKLDEQGWVTVEALLDTLRPRHPQWQNLTIDDLLTMNAKNSKQRFEITESHIRAMYGHSTPGKLNHTQAMPPDILYHGTAPRFMGNIKKNGLLPMSRQYVHLSADTNMATLVGSRKDTKPIILKINASAAHNAGIIFYKGNDNVWLTDHIPPEYIEFID